jgi:hypothetical protein
MGQRPDEMNPPHRSEDVWGPDPPITRTNREASEGGTFIDADASPSTGPHSGASGDDSEKDVGELRGEIEHTRTELSETIDAIQERLNPQHLADEAQAAARDAATGLIEDAREAVREATVGKAERFMSDVEDSARETGSSMMDTIRQNPLPSALVGIGLYMLYRNRNRGDSSGARSHLAYRASYDSPNYEPGGFYRQDTQAGLGEVASTARERMGDVADQARSTASEVISGAGSLASDAGDRAMDLASSAGSTARGAGTSLWTNLQQNPVPAALTGLGIAWLMRSWDTSASSHSGYRPSSSEYGSSYRHENEDHGNRIGDALTHADQFGRQVDQFGRQVPDRAQDMLQGNPLMVGALAFGLGAAAGLAVPSTQKESELMGGARETLIERTTSTLQDTQQRVQQAMDDAHRMVQSDGGSESRTEQHTA